MTYHGDEPDDTWVSTTQEWLTDLDRDTDYSDEDDDPELDEADEPDPDNDALNGAPAEMNIDSDGSELPPDDGDPAPDRVPGDDDDLNPLATSRIDDVPAPADAPGDDATPQAADEPPRYNKAIVGGFVALVLVAALGLTSALLAMRRTPEVEQSPDEASIKVAAAPQAAPPPPDVPRAAGIPFTAEAPGCLPGSTAAQSVASGDPTQAWVCVRGGVDGQVLTIDLGRTMAVTCIRITPGWVGTDSSGADQWLQHRVLTRVQWILADHGNQPTLVKQNTGNVHGEAPQCMQGQGVLASTITMIVQETSRPTVDAPPSDPAAPPGPGGLLDQVIGAPLNAPTPESPIPGLPQDQSQNDPVDNTFAVSSIVIEGHPPLPS
ncbi:hypothetical protein JNN96_36185 [Mycobacterium sp. DSM 3803]|nr:hypothetical protein [Mycobacterium sp. DSM 3803]